MSNRFHYIMTGAGLTLLVVLGVLVLLLPQAQADDSFTPTVNNRVVSETAVQARNQTEKIQVVTHDDQAKHSQESNLADVKSAPELSVEAQITPLKTDSEPMIGPELILTQVWEFARQQERDLLGRDGWIYVEEESYAPVQFKGGGNPGNPDMPISQLYPDDTSTFKSWNHVDEAGIVYEWFSINESPDGIVRQSTVMRNGRSVNLTLRDAGLPKEHYTMEEDQLQKIGLPIPFIYELLEEARHWPNVHIQAHQEKDSFIVSWEQMYTEPLETNLPEPITGTRSIYTFDQHTGQLHTSEFQFLPLNGKWQTQERYTYLTIQWLPQLPAEIDQLFQGAVNLIEQ